ncbi:M14 family zinc carboxypeptidase [Aestuariibacter sp. AA17]|uniref:M14 family zinc carboxypeptidase n=1 Tax=Fluctibacter corallii TaxID=2984329 RepID=A0ABT3A6L8_9ALTE|nr:M14 family zinc carboxypeptidase [Aestuariibacter sp. AA17]MCV2883996.1 M14 family zinc carboxypeptidase [Aestuariibacter sp. AA17]
MKHAPMHDDFSYQAFDALYESHFANRIALPRVRHVNIETHIAEIKNWSWVQVEEVGQSFSDRSIYLVTVGSGNTSLFAWSQMHGDESTATASIFDFLFMLNALPENERKACLDEVTFHFLPMLNPDGAEVNTRYNAQGIDINRDARNLQSPEGRLLHSLLNRFSPDYAFNLHDQSPYYGAGKRGKPAILSFLAPPMDAGRQCPPHRERAMALISHYVNRLTNLIPECMGRYDDTYSPIAFGDYATQSGASCILIESGAHDTSDKRELARRLNVWLLFQTLKWVNNTSTQYSTRAYLNLPQNAEDHMTDLLIKGVKVKAGSKMFSLDMAIDFQRHNTGCIRELGDLGDLAGFITIQASELAYQTGQVFNVVEPFTLSDSVYFSFLLRGVLFFHDPENVMEIQTCLPVLTLSQLNKDNNLPKRHKKQVNFLLCDECTVRYVVLHGRPYSLQESITPLFV